MSFSENKWNSFWHELFKWFFYFIFTWYIICIQNIKMLSNDFILKISPVLLPEYEHVITLLIHSKICSPLSTWLYKSQHWETKHVFIFIVFWFQNPYLAWVCFLDILLFDHSFFSSISRSFAWKRKLNSYSNKHYMRFLNILITVNF